MLATRKTLKKKGKCLKHCDEDYKFYCDKYLLPGSKNKDRRTTN